MAEALVMANSDYTHPDPDIDRRGVHKRGDIIIIKPDGHPWGGAELDTNKFFIISVPDSWLTDANEYGGVLIQSRAQATPFAIRKSARMERLHNAARRHLRKTLKRHRYSLDLDNGNTLIDHRSE